jgi:3-phenylpropionate/trans-cinnamate dioxygenase ferredoxin reductase subunit
MSPVPTFVIVGASLAGAKAAETLRAEGFDGRLLLVGEEPVRPYERPPLSKEYLRGEKGFDHAAVHTAGFYEDQEIELLTSTTVTAIDPGARRVDLSTGGRVGYDKLLLASGATPRLLQVPGASLDGALYLRRIADSDAIREALKSAGQVVVIGAGWIGAEVAASARQLGASVAMVEMAQVPLQAALGAEVGAVFRELHAEHGVELHFGVGVEALQGARSVEAVRLTDGSVLPADVVVVGVGVVPRDELARAAGIATTNGVTVDEHLATSAPGVYAAGDVASAFHPTYQAHIRLEHWSSALNQGPVAARNMLGQEVVYDRVPYFFSDQYDFGMEYRGLARGADDVVLRGDPASRQFIAFWLKDGVVQAAMNANIWDAGQAIEALVALGQPVDRGLLASPGTDLAELAQVPARGREVGG